MTTDEEAEAFLDADLSDLDFTQFKPVTFQIGGEAAVSRVERQSTEVIEADDTTKTSGLRPGAPTPRSGIYEQRGPRGGYTGLEADSIRGKPLPPAPEGRTWTLVGPSSQNTGPAHHSKNPRERSKARGKK